MSMNMLPMQFDREIGPPSRLQELISKMSGSRRVRYGVSIGLVVFVLCLYLVTGGGSGGRGTASSPSWTGDKGDQDIEQPASNVEPPARFQRADRVRSAFLRAYTAYEKHAFPHDELLPLSNGHQDK